MTIAIEVIAGNPGTFTDTASVSADQADPNTKNNTATVTETVIAPPVIAPINLFVSLLDTGNGTFAPFVTWGIPTGSVVSPTFLIYRSTTSNGEGALPYGSPTSAHDLVDSVGKPGTTYYYQVAEVLDGTPGPRSSEASVTIPGSARLISRLKVPAGPATKFSKLHHRPVVTHTQPLTRKHPLKSPAVHGPSLPVTRQRHTVKIRRHHS